MGYRVKSDRIIAPDRDFVITAPDGTRLDATAYHPSFREVRGGVVVTHGLGRKLDQQHPQELSDTPDDAEKAVAMELARRGFYTLIFSHRGHNGSGGALSFRQSIADLEFVSNDYMRGARGYRDNLFAAGFSMGGYDALHVAAKRPDLYQAVVAISAPHSMREVLPDRVHKMIRKMLGNPKHERLGRYVIAALKIGLLNGGSMFGFLKGLATNPEERARLCSHIGECRLPDRLHELYIDLDKSPDLEDQEPVQTPVLLLHPEEDKLLYRRAGRDGYLDVFRRKVRKLRTEMVPGTTHHFAKDGRSLLALETQYADMIAEFFLDHMNGGGTGNGDSAEHTDSDAQVAKRNVG